MGGISDSTFQDQPRTQPLIYTFGVGRCADEEIPHIFRARFFRGGINEPSALSVMGIHLNEIWRVVDRTVISALSSRFLTLDSLLRVETTALQRPKLDQIEPSPVKIRGAVNEVF